MKIIFKTLLPILFILLLVGCSSKAPTKSIVSYPDWYKEQKIIRKNHYEIIGYGYAQTIREAKANAKENIILEISSLVDSRFESRAIYKSRNNKEEFKSRSKRELKITSKLNLQDLQTLKQEYKNGNYYVAVMYENIDLAHRVKKVISLKKCINEDINSFMSKTLLHKKITVALECDINIKLDRRNDAWYLKYKEYLFLLDDNDFEELFIGIKNKNINLKPSSTTLIEEERYHFNIDTKEKGYVTIFNVYPNGIVTVIASNNKIDKKIRLPKKSSEFGYASGLFENNPNTYDLYIAVFTKKPLNISRFENVRYSIENASNKMSFKFDELIGFIDKYEYSSVVIRTKAK